jgi:hypothetical protein
MAGPAGRTRSDVKTPSKSVGHLHPAPWVPRPLSHLERPDFGIPSASAAAGASWTKSS